MPHARQRQCAGCFRSFGGDPVFREDTAFCCRSCAGGALCTCYLEADLADDGVDGLGLAFAVPAPQPVTARMRGDAG